MNLFDSNVIVGTFFLFVIFLFSWLAKTDKERKERFEQKRKEHNEFKKRFREEEKRINKNWD